MYFHDIWNNLDISSHLQSEVEDFFSSAPIKSEILQMPFDSEFGKSCKPTKEEMPQWITKIDSYPLIPNDPKSGHTFHPSENPDWDAIRKGLEEERNKRLKYQQEHPSIWTKILHLDVLSCIFSFLNLLDCLRISYSTKQFYNTCSDQNLWKTKTIQLFPILKDACYQNWKRLARFLSARDFMLEKQERHYYDAFGDVKDAYLTFQYDRDNLDKIEERVDTFEKTWPETWAKSKITFQHRIIIRDFGKTQVGTDCIIQPLNIYLHQEEKKTMVKTSIAFIGKLGYYLVVSNEISEVLDGKMYAQVVHIQYFLVDSSESKIFNSLTNRCDCSEIS